METKKGEKEGENSQQQQKAKRFQRFFLKRERGGRQVVHFGHF